MEKVFIVEWKKLEDGGAEPFAFATREAAEQWIKDQPENPYKYWEVVEAELIG